MHDLIIIGAGPAGLAAALYATRKRLNYLVISRDLGGKSNYSVALPDSEDSHTIRAGELVTIYKSRLEYLRHSYRLTGVAKLSAGEDSFAVETEDGAHEQARAVIVATGTRTKKLDVPGEAQFLSRALGYSSISYSHLFARKHVFIAGDTNRVLDSALELSIHATKVSVALLADGDAAGGFDRAAVERLADLENVEMIEDAAIAEFTGNEYAQAVTLHSAGTDRTVKADGFFLELEPSPNTDFVSDSIELNGRGFLKVDGSGMTSLPGLYAAGDVTGNGYEQILVSLGEGAKAALSAYRYLIRRGLQIR
jgi:NADH-dependent peroxiredoxin subunit F